MPALLKTEHATAADEIRALAAQHGITAEKSDVDYMSDTFAELAGDTPIDHEVDQLVVNLIRANVLDKARGFALLNAHLSE